MAGVRRAGKGLSSCLYHDFVEEHRAFKEPLEPTSSSRHGASITATTPSGARVGLQTSVISPFFNKAVKRGVASTLEFESQLNPMLTSSLRISSQRHLELQAHLQASDKLRFTLEARESATEKTPASFARIGCDYKDESLFAGMKIDAVNGPTLQATCGVHIGSAAIGVLGAYDVGLDHSDRLGRFTELRMAATYAHDDVSALLQVNDKGKKVKVSVAQEISEDLMVGSEFLYDVRKDHKVLRLRSKYAMNESETVSSSLGSDGIIIGAYEWRTSAHLKTRVSAQMDVRNFDSDSHHLGVSIEIS
ncbi:hypothetical protein Poli38472_010572 [Pythium oligandrum]|uniref:Uncharacterized protein n=1 Tax=Pythium oligandrum TaxID=41045 RepID=A0A8K1C3B7_PYTOL|nr:hypothetical protein Poli38472_010572 [Pythium oligandrum]|eukprot:TMW55690.1 hypothetical protein Poli38472_010572 [Pythium oligandrum]